MTFTTFFPSEKRTVLVWVWMAFVGASESFAQAPNELPPTSAPELPAATIEELAKVPCEIPERLVAKVFKAQSDHPRRNLPSGDAVKLYSANAASYAAWFDKNVVKAYDEVGNRDPKWDDGAHEILKLLTPSLPDLGKLKDQDRTTVNARWRDIAPACSDPLIQCLMGLLRVSEERYPEAEQLLEKATRGFAESKYSMFVRHLAPSSLSIAYGLRYGPKDQRFLNAEQRAIRELVAGIDEDLCTPQQLRPLFYFVQSRSSVRRAHEHFAQILPALRAKKGVDPWIIDMAAGEFHREYGWHLRGSEFANRVRGEQFASFHDQLKLARAHYMSAWNRYPQHPQAAANMIAVAMAAPEGRGDTPRFWFDEAVAAEFDYMPSYNRLRWALRPRWGGSHEEMFSLGKECADSSRFDTDVPFVLFDAISDIASETNDKRSVWSNAEYFAELKKLYSAAIAAPRLESRRDRLRTVYAAVLLWGGDKAAAKRLLDELGDRANASAAAGIGTTLEDLRREAAGAAASTGNLNWWPKGIAAADFARDRKYMAIGEKEGKIQLIRMGNEPKITALDATVFDDGVLALSPNSRSLAAVVNEGVQIFDVETGRATHLLQVAATPNLRGLAFSPDGKTLVAVSGKENAREQPGVVEIWDAEDGKQRKGFKPHRHAVNYVAYSPTGESFATSSSDFVVPMGGQRPHPGEVKIHQANTGEEIRTIEPFPSMCSIIEFSSDGKRLAVVGSDKPHDRWMAFIRIFDVETGKQTAQLGPFGSWPTAIRFADENRRMIVGDQNGYIGMFDASNGKYIRRVKCPGGFVRSLGFSTTGALLIPHAIGRINRLTLDFGDQITVGLSGWHDEFQWGAEIVVLKFSPDGKHLFFQLANEDVWRAAVDAPVSTSLAACDGVTVGMALSKDGTRLAAVGGKRDRKEAELNIFDASSAKRLGHYTKPVGLYFTAAFMPEGYGFAKAGVGGEIEFCDTEGRTWGRATGHTNTVRALAASPDGKLLASLADDGSIRTWQLPPAEERTANEQRAIKGEIFAENLGSNARFLAFTPDGAAVAFVDSNTVRVRSIDDKADVFSAPGELFSLSDDGSLLATVGGPGDNRLKSVVWNLQTKKQVAVIDGGHRGRIKAVAISPDNKYLVTGGDDQMINWWEIKTGKIARPQLPKR